MSKTHHVPISKYFMWAFFITALIIASYFVWSKYGGKQYLAQPTEFGVTFSTTYATSLGLDWKEVYIAALDDLGIKHFRIPIYWNQIEQEPGNIVLDDVIWLAEEAEKRDAKIMFVVGRRVPRWPECHVPDWTKDFTENQIRRYEIKMLGRVVSVLKNYPAVERWQVQNEPYFKYFGECPAPDPDFIAQSIAVVRKVDSSRQIVITDSGELSTWLKAASVTDVLGISMYRITWSPVLGYLRYPLPPLFYTARAAMFNSLVDDVIVTELQAEPWVQDDITTTPLTDQFESMNPDKFRDNIDYVRQTGFSEVYLWGVEWWYWLKVTHNDASMWETSRSLFYKKPL